MVDFYGELVGKDTSPMAQHRVHGTVDYFPAHQAIKITHSWIGTYIHLHLSQISGQIKGFHQPRFP